MIHTMVEYCGTPPSKSGSQLATHIFAHPDKTFTPADLNFGLKHVVVELYTCLCGPCTSVLRVNDRFLHQMFASFCDKHHPLLRYKSASHLTNSRDHSTFNTSGGHTDQTGDANYGQARIDRLHPALTMPAYQRREFTAVSQFWQFFIGISPGVDDTTLH